MPNRQLVVIAGELSRTRKPKATLLPQDALAKRWRAAVPSASCRPDDLPDVISLMDAWIRRLEREAESAAPPPSAR